MPFSPQAPCFPPAPVCITLAFAHHFVVLVIGACLIVSCLPSSSGSIARARLASGGPSRSAQPCSGGRQYGTAIGPLLAAFIVIPYGQAFPTGLLIALLGFCVLSGVSVCICATGKHSWSPDAEQNTAL